MTQTGLRAFDSTMQKTHEWLNAIAEELHYEDRIDAYSALRATLMALRDRLTVDQAVHLGSQLPMLVRGFYYEGWDPSKSPRHERHLEAFLEHVRQNLRPDIQQDVQRIVPAVFHVMSREIDIHEVPQVLQALPHEMQRLWNPPEAA